MAKLQPKISLYVKGMSKDVRKYKRVINRCLAKHRRNQKAEWMPNHEEIVAEYLACLRAARGVIALSKKVASI